MSHSSPSEPRLFAEHPDDETLEVWLDGELVETFTYDGIGYAGFDAIKRLVEKLAADL